MTFKQLILISSLIISSTLTFAANEQPLALLLTNDTQSLGGDGIFRTEHFQEQLIRQQNTVWVARVIPKGAHNPKEHAKHDEDHKHLDVSAAARLIAKDNKGQLNVRLVEFNDKFIVNVPKAEYDAVGFDGNWNTAYYLIDPATLKKFKATNRTAPKNARWFESQNPQSFIHVLWDEKNQYPLQVESGSLDGRLKRTVKASIQPFPAKTPWSVISKFNVKDYSDFLD